MMRRVAVFVAALWMVAGCSGSSPAAPGPTPTPTPTPVTQTLTGTVGAFGVSSQAFTPSQGGTLTATLTWTPSADLDLYVTASSCTGYPPDACAILARSTSSTGTHEDTTLTVAAGVPLLFWIDNFHPTAAVPYVVSVTVR